MTTDDFLVQLAKAMAGWIDLDPSSILFADDRDIKYDPPRKSTLNRATLFAPADHLRLREYTEGTHSWVHANLLTTIDGVQVISLRHSAPGTLRKDAVVPFSVNASRDPTSLHIVDQP